MIEQQETQLENVRNQSAEALAKATGMLESGDVDAGTLPLIMRRLKLDPALASGPILTTVTDMCGFFLVLGSATFFLNRLV